MAAGPPGLGRRSVSCDLMKLFSEVRMALDELATRGRQETRKWLERMGAAAGVDGRLRLLPTDAGTGQAAERGPQMTSPGPARTLPSPWLLEDSAPRFFGGAVSERALALLEERFPGIRDRTLAAAEAVCSKRFDLLGYRGLSFGDPVDWHLDPLSGRRAPLEHWSRLDPLDAGALGDVKLVWELNRHQWLIPLCQAYRLTSEERYARTAVAYLRDWMRANPPGLGINWTSSLEVALRLISWCWAAFLLRGSKALSPEFLADLVEGVRLHAHRVERYLSRYFSPNTHLTGEALGLFYAGTLFQDLRRARRWREVAWAVLVQESARQILEDGVYFEQSTWYQRYTIEIYLHFLLLAGRNDVPVPLQVGERVQRMLEFLLAVRSPAGALPQIGDADGGWLLPLHPRAPSDVRGVLSTAAALFGRPDFAWAAGGPAPEALWLLGPEGLTRLDSLRPAPPAGPPSRVFPSGGYVVMRSDWSEWAHQLILDAGPLGCPHSSAHGHADLLAVQCSAFGAPYIVDPGTFCYAADLRWRDHFRGSAAHSTVVVDGVPQALPAGPFQWESRPTARLIHWAPDHGDELATAEHDAYRRLPGAVAHRRRVLFARRRYFVVVDDLGGEGEHRVELRFQFAPMPVAAQSGPWVRARHPEGHGLLLGVFSRVPMEIRVNEGGLSPMRGWVSPDFGLRRPAPVVLCAARTRLPLRVLTVLLPIAHPLAPPPAARTLASGDGELDGVVLGNGEEIVRVDERDVFLDHG